MIRETSFVVIVFLLVFSVHTAIWNENPRNFKPGNLYQFKYSSQVLSGLPKSSSEYNGLQINGVVRFQFKSNSKVVMTLKDIELLETAATIRTRNPYNFLIGKQLKNVKLIKSNSFNALLMPVSFKWNVEEKLMDFKANSKDDPFSLNIKRGILNMINMKLEFGKDGKKTEGNYVVKEDEGIDGLCEANYMWSSYPYNTPGLDETEFKSISVMRTKSANKCKEPLGFDRANFVWTKTRYNGKDANRTLVKNINAATMNITVGKSKKFFLWEAMSKSSYFIQPMIIESESITTFVVQTLTFLSEKKYTKTDISEKTVKKSFRMELSIAKVSLTTSDKQRIIQLIERLGDFNVTHIPDLLLLLRQAEDKDMKEITVKVLSIFKKDKKIMQPYLDILSQVLTLSSTKSLMQDFVLKPSPFFDDDYLMSMRIFPLSGLSNVPDKELIDVLKDAASSSILLNDPSRTNTLQAVLFGIASLVGSHYSQNTKYDITKAIKFFTKELAGKECSLSKETKSFLAIKSLGNIGAIECLPYLKDVIINKSAPLLQRILAIKSLRKLPRRDSKIEQMLVNIFNDINEDVELRINSGYDIILRHRKKSTLNLMAVILEREPIRQVKAFMQDLIYQLSKWRNYKDTFRPLLRRLKLKDYSDAYSSTRVISSKSGKIVINLIYTPESEIIRSANVMFFDFKFGRMFIFCEIGFRIETSKTVASKKNILNKNPNTWNMMASYRKYGNDVGNWRYNEGPMPKFGIPDLESLIKLINLAGAVTSKLSINDITNGEVHLPTTMGLKYTAQIHSAVNMGFELSSSNVLQQGSNSDRWKMQIKLHVEKETLFDIGIDAGLIKSGINARIYLGTSKAMGVTILMDEKTKLVSIGMMKPSNDINLLKYLLKKSFKVTYYKTTDTLLGTTYYSDITPFYVTEGKLRKQKKETIGFPFGMDFKWSYYCDVGKPRTDGNLMSILSAGDALIDVWIMRNKKSEFDEFQIEMRKEISQYVVSLNHLKNQETKLKIDLMTFKIEFGMGLKLEVKWPEKMKYVAEAAQVLTVNSKKPEIKFTRLYGSINIPSPIQFIKNEPFKMLRHKKEYGYGFKGSITNSKREVLLNSEVLLGIDEGAKELAKNIAKNPSRYAAHDEAFSQCSKDIMKNMSNSPSCFNSWLTLNNYNKFTFSLNWTKDGFTRFKRIYNRLNQRWLISKYLTSEKFIDNRNDYQLEYISSPFFYPSSTASISIRSLTNVYRRVIYPRQNIGRKMFRKFDKITDNRGYKICQIRRGVGKMVDINTFDKYIYNVKELLPTVTGGNSSKLIFVQDETNTFQISIIKTTDEWIIQVISEALPTIRIIRKGNNVDFYTNDKKINSQSISVNNKIAVTFKRLSNTIHGKMELYEIDLLLHNIRILSDMNQMVDIEASTIYWSSLRGTCGDMNGEVFNEFKNAKCTGNYATPESMFITSDYASKFKSVNDKQNSFVPIKVCSKSTKLSLL